MLIAVGCSVYIFFRPNIILFSVLGLTDILSHIKIEMGVSDDFFSYFFKYCLSDVLWYASLLILAPTFYIKESFVSKFLFCLMIIMPFLFEFLQSMDLIPGTFDWYDIIFYGITLLINVIVWIKKTNQSYAL